MSAERAPAAPGKPPLSMRFTPRFWVRLDRVTAAGCAVLVFATLAMRPRTYWYPFYASGYAPSMGRLAIPLLLAVGLAIPVAIRRRDPPRALVLALAGTAAVLALGYEINTGPFVPLALVVFSVAATCARKVAVAGLAAALGLLIVQGLILSVGGRGSGPAVGVMLILIIAWMAGTTALQRRSYAARVREQVASAAVTEERLRIARELHDVVAHSMTVVAVQAGFGEYVFEHEPAEARAALGAIQQVTGEALADMQRLLGVLRQGDPSRGPEPARALQLAPAPGLADLDRLVSTTAGAGVRVDVARAGDLAGIPAGVDQSAFRIVQEALTNVVRHSGADSCQVTVARHHAGLQVEITDSGNGGQAPGAGPAHGTDRPGPPEPAGGTGNGIIGMRERVSLCGGEFTAGPMPGRGFRVAARFPLNGVPRSGAAQ